MNEFAPLLLQDKQEGFRRIGEMFLNGCLYQKGRIHLVPLAIDTNAKWLIRKYVN